MTDSCELTIEETKTSDQLTEQNSQHDDDSANKVSEEDPDPIDCCIDCCLICCPCCPSRCTECLLAPFDWLVELFS